MFYDYEVPDEIGELERIIKKFSPDPEQTHERYVQASILEAIEAAKEGNFGVGAVIVDPGGQIVMGGHNHVFNPHFRSDIHAEMDVMSKFEDAFTEVASMRNYMLFTSLEPCPMCLTRLITSGVGQVYHAAPDVETGMVSRLKDLSPVWVDLAESQIFAQADCSPELIDIALQVFLVTANINTQQLMDRR
jgi:tRNA(Arg) A34 adenosine deaminase TadA